MKDKRSKCTENTMARRRRVSSSGTSRRGGRNLQPHLGLGQGQGQGGMFVASSHACCRGKAYGK
jgi:hypothetical protein